VGVGVDEGDGVAVGGGVSVLVGVAVGRGVWDGDNTAGIEVLVAIGAACGAPHDVNTSATMTSNWNVVAFIVCPLIKCRLSGVAEQPNGLELSGPAKIPSSEFAELAGSAPASGWAAI
jgi:hypothetical protein